jgi:hypothetical protein
MVSKLDPLKDFAEAAREELLRLCHVGAFYLSIGRGRRRPPCVKSTSYARTHKPKTASKWLILGEP